MTTMSSYVHQWSVYEVSDWLSQNGYGTYTHQFEAEEVSGDVLLHLMHDTLRDLNVLSVGHRLGILKAIYRLKLEYNIPIDNDDFIPQDIDIWTEDQTSKSIAISHNAKLGQVTNEINHISHELKMLRDHLLPVLRQIAGRPETSESARTSPHITAIPKGSASPIITVSNLSSENSPSATAAAVVAANAQKRAKPAALNLFSSGSIKESARSPLPFLIKKDKQATRSPTAERNSIINSTPSSPYLKSEPRLANFANPATATLNTNAIRVYGDRLPGRENEAYKALRITLESTSQQILDMALKKYNLVDDGKNYALFIVHGNRKRYFGLEDRPLKFYQQLQQAGENPMFVMRPNSQLNQPAPARLATPSTSPLPAVPARLATPPVPPLPNAPAASVRLATTPAPPLRPPPPPPTVAALEQRSAAQRKRDVRSTIIGGVSPLLQNQRLVNELPPVPSNGNMTATDYASNGSTANIVRRKTQATQPHYRHRPHGSISETSRVNFKPIKLSALEASKKLSSSTPQSFGLQTAMNERFDELLEQWHQERKD